MKLKAFLDRKKLTQAVFAARIGVGQQSVSRYLDGRIPTPAVLRKIVAATRGAVTPNDFYVPRPTRRADAAAQRATPPADSSAEARRAKVDGRAGGVA